jgi:hypothetical protein
LLFDLAKKRGIYPRVNEFIDFGLKLMKNDFKTGNLLKIPKCDIFRNMELERGLYVREEYLKLHEITNEFLVDKEDEMRVLIIGSPGIGKSMFAVYLLLWAINQHQNIAYCPLKGKMFYFSWNDNQYECSEEPFSDYEYVAYFDGEESSNGSIFEISNRKHTFLFSSPRKTHFNEFKKVRCGFFCMNPWDRHELKDFVYKTKLKNDELDLKFNLVGGIPRIIFDNSDFDTLKENVFRSIPSNLEILKDLIHAVEGYKIDDKMEHCLFNFFRSEKNNNSLYIMYSSLVVEAVITTRYNIQSVTVIRDLLKTSNSDLQSWRGKNLERILLSGTSTSLVQCKSLEGTKTFDFGPLNAGSAVIQSYSDIRNEKMLYLPLSKTFPCIDGVLVIPDEHLIIYIQSTVSEVHAIKYQPLCDGYNILKGRDVFVHYTHILLFIVSDDIYDTFRVQKYINKDGSIRKRKEEVDIKQYVGKLV